MAKPGFSLVSGSGDHSLAVGLGLLIVLDSLVSELRLYSKQTSEVVMHRLSCPAPRGIFPDLGLNLFSLHWLMDS